MWMFKLKCKADGSINRYKARWIARGFNQSWGIDYNKTFAPVVHKENLPTLLALAVIHDLEIHQMDVDTVFLNADFKEEIYITQPEGFINEAHPDDVCKLNKSLYGLKQALREWFLLIDEHLKKSGYAPTKSDSCIYFKSKGESIAIIALYMYVDNCTIFASKQLLEDAKAILNSRFKMKDLGEAQSLLGKEVVRNRDLGTIMLCQAAKIEEALQNGRSSSLQYTYAGKGSIHSA